MLVKIKKLYRAFWPRVTKSKAKYAFLSVDYSRWREQSSCSSSEDDELLSGKCMCVYAISCFS